MQQVEINTWTTRHLAETWPGAKRASKLQPSHSTTHTQEPWAHEPSTQTEPGRPRACRRPCSQRPLQVQESQGGSACQSECVRGWVQAWVRAGVCWWGFGPSARVLRACHVSVVGSQVHSQARPQLSPTLSHALGPTPRLARHTGRPSLALERLSGPGSGTRRRARGRNSVSVGTNQRTGHPNRRLE